MKRHGISYEPGKTGWKYVGRNTQGKRAAIQQKADQNSEVTKCCRGLAKETTVVDSLAAIQPDFLLHNIWKTGAVGVRFGCMFVKRYY
jgi:hypothetical protein